MAASEFSDKDCVCAELREVERVKSVNWIGHIDLCKFQKNSKHARRFALKKKKNKLKASLKQYNFENDLAVQICKSEASVILWKKSLSLAVHYHGLLSAKNFVSESSHPGAVTDCLGDLKQVS